MPVNTSPWQTEHPWEPSPEAYPQPVPLMSEADLINPLRRVADVIDEEAVRCQAVMPLVEALRLLKHSATGAVPLVDHDRPVGFGRWGGVRVSEILDRCQPLPGARYLVFRSFGKHEKTGRQYYECVDLHIGQHPQTILAYELNGVALPLQHGAPLRPRFETKLGFKMVKFLQLIEVVDSYRHIGGGMGGIREDEQQFDKGAEI